jgi:hypothetical protein
MSVSPASRSLRSEAISKWHGAWYPYSKRSRRVMWTLSARMAPQSVTRRFAILGGEKLTEEQEEQGTAVMGGAGSVVVPVSLIIHSPEVRMGAPELIRRFQVLREFYFRLCRRGRSIQDVIIPESHTHHIHATGNFFLRRLASQRCGIVAACIEAAMNFFMAHLFETFVAFGCDFRQLRKAASNAPIHAQQGCRSSPI